MRVLLVIPESSSGHDVQVNNKGALTGGTVSVGAIKKEMLLNNHTKTEQRVLFVYLYLNQAAFNSRALRAIKRGLPAAWYYTLT